MSQFVVTVDRFEGDFAVLKHKDHEILLPREDLPEDINEGSLVTIITMSGNKEKELEKTRTEKVENVLFDIISTGIGAPIPAENEQQAEKKKIEEVSSKVDELNKKVNEKGEGK